jgi:hypothetical protein
LVHFNIIPFRSQRSHVRTIRGKLKGKMALVDSSIVE